MLSILRLLACAAMLTMPALAVSAAKDTYGQCDRPDCVCQRAQPLLLLLCDLALAT